MAGVKHPQVQKGDKWMHGNIRYTVTGVNENKQYIILYVDSPEHDEINGYNVTTTRHEFMQFVRKSKMRRVA